MVPSPRRDKAIRCGTTVAVHAYMRSVVQPIASSSRVHRPPPVRSALSLCLTIVVAGCLDPDRTPLGNPCAVADPPPVCSMECASSGEACPAGFHCGALGTCTAECTPSAGCDPGQVCSVEGRCTTASIADASVCPNAELDTRMVVPNVVLIVDQSGTMGTQDLSPGVKRWDALEGVLVGENGVGGTGLIHDFQDRVRFGLALYRGPTSDDPDRTCPIVTTEPAPLVSLGLNAYPSIKATFDQADPIGWTPTHLAMERVLDGLLGRADPLPGPVLLIVATDGEPTECEGRNPEGVKPQVIAQTRRAFENGIRTYVISLAGDHEDLQAHLDEVANVGLGMPADSIPPATSWAPTDTAGLRDALDAIIGGALSCTVELSGPIDPTSACNGTVTLNGDPLPCDDPNGWRAIDSTHIELLGSACGTLSDSAAATLRASFPCSSILI